MVSVYFYIVPNLEMGGGFGATYWYNYCQPERLNSPMVERYFCSEFFTLPSIPAVCHVTL
jgi:hypothetical protein